MTPAPPDRHTAASRAAAARRTRAEWVLSVHLGVTTVPDLIRAARTPEGRPLLRARLATVLAAQDGWSRTRALDAVAHIHRVLGEPADTPARAAARTVQWLVDARCGGHRLHALADALNTPRTAPWAGFPYTPAPQKDEETR